MSIFIHVNGCLISTLNIDIDDRLTFKECSLIAESNFKLFLSERLENITNIDSIEFNISRQYDGNVVVDSNLPKSYLRDLKIKEITT